MPPIDPQGNKGYSDTNVCPIILIVIVVLALMASVAAVDVLALKYGADSRHTDGRPNL